MTSALRRKKTTSSPRSTLYHPPEPPPLQEEDRLEGQRLIKMKKKVCTVMTRIVSLEVKVVLQHMLLLSPETV